MLAVLLIKISKMYPTVARMELSTIPDKEKQYLLMLMKQKMGEVSYFSISREGQEVYQKLLLKRKFRSMFADGIQSSGSTNNVNDFFEEYIKKFFSILDKEDKKNKKSI